MVSQEEIKDLVIARLEMLPDDKKISIGSKGEFTKEEIIEHVKKGDLIGKMMIDIELGFLRDMKEGFVLNE